jgi:hypothetical protein
MIARNITKSKKIQQLSDRERVIYAFMLPFLDREGRINAHPKYLKGVVFLQLEYSEAEIEAAISRLHDVGLGTVYPTEDAVVFQFVSFHEYNKPNRNEVGSEFPPPSDELLSRPELRPPSTRQTPPPCIAHAMHMQCTGNAPPEVEVEVEVEVEAEAEVKAHKKNNVSSLMTPPPPAGKAAASEEETSKLFQPLVRS